MRIVLETEGAVELEEGECDGRAEGERVNNDPDEHLERLEEHEQVVDLLLLAFRQYRVARVEERHREVNVVVAAPAAPLVVVHHVVFVCGAEGSER